MEGHPVVDLLTLPCPSVMVTSCSQNWLCKMFLPLLVDTGVGSMPQKDKKALFCLVAVCRILYDLHGCNLCFSSLCVRLEKAIDELLRS